MEFIKRGVDRREDKGNSRHSLTVLTQGAKQQRREKRVFGEVATLTDDELHRSNGGVRHLRREPTQKRTDESRGVLRGKQIGRPDENKNHPDESRKPIFQKETDFHRTAKPLW